MPLSQDRIQALAEQAGLSLSVEERHQLERDLNALLDFVDELVELGEVPADFAAGAPSGGCDLGDEPTPLRPDSASRALPRAELLAVVPEARQELVVVPGQSGRTAARAGAHAHLSGRSAQREAPDDPQEQQ